VRSSTSNSNERLPSGPWLRTWLVAGAIALAILGTWEGYWRSRGWAPTVEANEDSWIIAWGRIRPTSTVFTGTSRIQAALDPAIWVSELGGEPPVQLALAGGSPTPVLETLAADSAFHGLIVVDLLPLYSLDASLESEERVVDYLRAYHVAQRSPVKRMEAMLRIHLPYLFVFRRDELLPGEFFQNAWEGRWPDAGYDFLRPDRYHPLYFSRSKLEPNSARVNDPKPFAHLLSTGRPAKGAELDSMFSRIGRSVTQIQQRGGEVVFILFQACGGRRTIEEQLYPKREYWDRFRAQTTGIALDSDDYPMIRSQPCYDGSHIDGNAAPAVTRLIAQALQEKGISRRPQ
jgi:hypothetical protein